MSSTAPSNRASPSAPTVIVVAKGVNPLYLYQTSTLTSIPSYLLVPLNGVRVTLQALNRADTPVHERVPPVAFKTNSSGVAAAVVPPGNYSVFISGPNLNLNTTTSLAANSTTTIRLELDPSAFSVASVRLVSPDSHSGVEPTTTMSLLLGGKATLRSGFAELVGYTSFPPLGGVVVVGGDQLVVNATVVGSYLATQGYWAVLSPSGSYATYPTTNVVLFQFKPVLEVSSAAG